MPTATIATSSANAGTSRVSIPTTDTLPTFFRPFVLEVFARKAYDPSVIRAGERAPSCRPKPPQDKEALSLHEHHRQGGCHRRRRHRRGLGRAPLLNGIDVSIFDPDPGGLGARSAR